MKLLLGVNKKSCCFSGRAKKDRRPHIGAPVDDCLDSIPRDVRQGQGASAGPI